MTTDFSWQQRPPKFSIAMPVHDPELEDLRRAVESVRSQAWPHVELCLVNDSSQKPEIIAYLEDIAKEPGVQLETPRTNLGIAGATNAAVALCSGDFVVFLDHDDELTTNALSRLAEEIRAHPEADLLYSDHDVIDADGRRLHVEFKPDWSPDLLLSYMYVGHIKVARLGLVRELGGFREGFDGAADYDFLLRLAERTDRIRHVPEVLYHWRAAVNSMARRSDTKTHSFDSGRRALQEALERRDIAADAEWPGWARRARLGVFHVRYRPEQTQAKISILIPTRDRLDLLSKCVASIEERTDYANWQIVILDNDSREPETLNYLSETSHRVVHVPGDFNFSRIVNRGVEACDGEFIVLLNNDTVVVSHDWLQELLGVAVQPGVGAVGAKLLYPDGRIQHAGVTLGVHGLTAHAFDGHPDRYSPLEVGYYAHVCRNVSAVTAACLMVRRSTYLEVGGFDEEDLGVAWNDTDFCLRLGAQGFRVIVNAHAELIHLGSVSRGDAKNDHEVSIMFERWAPQIDRDPFYNPNLSRLKTDFSPRTRLDERRYFHYTASGFSAHPPEFTAGLQPDGASEQLPKSLLHEIVRAQDQTLRQLQGDLQRFEGAERAVRILASRPILSRIRRILVRAGLWSAARRFRQTAWGSRMLRRLGLIH